MNPEYVFIFPLLALGCIAFMALFWFMLDHKYTQTLSQTTHSLRTKLTQELSDKYTELKERKQKLQQREILLKKQEQALLETQEKQQAEHQAALYQLAGLNPEEARQKLLLQWEEQSKDRIHEQLKNWQNFLEQEKNRLSQEILTRTIERLSTSFTQEGLITIIDLPHKSWRGKLLGKDGRNIQSLQHATGADISIEELPPQAILSCFDPFRRQLATNTIKHLFKEPGRIYPSLIKQIASEEENNLKNSLASVGRQAAESCGVEELHVDILRTLGLLNYRNSYGQNALKHSQEVAQLAASLAKQLGANIQIARRAGLLHDLGKALGSEQPASHTELGVDQAHACGESPEVLHAMAAHHNEVKPLSLEAWLVQIADRLSAARPGARHQPIEKHIQRLKKMEQLALEFPEVQNAMVLKSGREIQVLVDPDEISESDLSLLASKLARKIETTLDLPGQVRVNVLREIQASDFAR